MECLWAVELSSVAGWEKNDGTAAGEGALGGVSACEVVAASPPGRGGGGAQTHHSRDGQQRKGHPKIDKHGLLRNEGQHLVEPDHQGDRSVGEVVARVDGHHDAAECDGLGGARAEPGVARRGGGRAVV